MMSRRANALSFRPSDISSGCDASGSLKTSPAAPYGLKTPPAGRPPTFSASGEDRGILVMDRTPSNAEPGRALNSLSLPIDISEFPSRAVLKNRCLD